MKIVSACLAGIKCRWDGTAKPCDSVIEMVKNGEAIPICPEQLGGLTTPRSCAEQKNDSILTKEGEDVTFQFKKGAQEALNIAKLYNCQEVILKSKSPSCGSGVIYDGGFSGKLIVGDGVFAKILKENNINVLTEDDL